MLKNICLSLLLLLTSFGCKENKNKDQTAQTIDESELKIGLVHDTITKKVHITLNGLPFTSYVYDGQTPKPILFPIQTKSGKTLTRGFPFEPRENERVDHPHHAGLWLNYGDVNGIDFWNNSYAIAEEEKHRYGTIVHNNVLEVNEQKGLLKIAAFWRSHEGIDLLEETTEFRFGEKNNTRFIDRTTTLRALAPISFTDNKEGMLGIRVARALELPSDKPAVFTDSNGISTNVEATNNEGVNGNYYGSEGLTGSEVWGTRNKWVKLEGTMEDEKVSITIIDHPKNIGYPTYWHARGYGLFAANPLGQAVFSEGKESLNFKLDNSASVTFKYRILIHNGSELTRSELDLEFDAFTQNQ